MSRRDDIGGYVEQVGLGPLEHRVKLVGSLPLGDGSQAPAELCLVHSGVFVVAARSATVGTATQLTDSPSVRLETGRVRSNLIVEGHSFGVSRLRRQQVERLLALGRIRAQTPARHLSPPSGVLVDPPTEIEAAWLAGALAPGEIVLAWLGTESTRLIPSWLGGTVPAPVRLLLTMRRLLAVALSGVGDDEVFEFDPDRMRLEQVRGCVQLAHDQRVVSSSRRTAEAFRRLERAARLHGSARVLEVARTTWVQHDPGYEERATALIEVARRHGEPLAPFVEFLAKRESKDGSAAKVDLASGLSDLARHGKPADVLVELHRNWGFKAATGQALVAALRELAAPREPWALELHRFVREAASTKGGDPLEAARQDIELAEHLLDVDERQRAAELLEARLHQLPRETLAELLPPGDADLTRGAGGQTLRTRIFELLASARGDGSQRDEHAVMELARLHPLVADQMRGLASVANEDLKRRANAVLALLDPSEPLALDQQPELLDSVRPLSDKLINEVLRHPASRADSPLLARLQELLAAAPKPDVGMLRDYCEELNQDAYPDAVVALREANRALGTRVRAYVSRGTKGVGLRAYENDKPFILIGGQHLSNSDFMMSRAELQFAIGAELAHLRFGHVRVTSNDVWAGTLEKGQQGLDMALSVLPILGGWKLADRAVKVTSRVPIPIVRRALGAAGSWKAAALNRSMRPASPQNDDVLSTLNEQLVVAHRVMQLSADRAGLVLAQDIRPALRAMLLIRRDYHAEIPSMERKGLANVLGIRAEDGHMAYQDLAVRIAALLSFYLSDEFVRLRAALYD